MDLPGLQRLRAYERSWLRPDLLGGLTVGAMLIPQSMAYAELGGMPPETGFYAVLLALIVYALLGSSRHLGVGPEPGTAILSATAVGALAGGDASRYLALMATLALMVASVCLLAYVLRLGFLADLLSRPVLVGYITGVGATLISSQLAKVTGISIAADDFFGRFFEFATRLSEIHGLTLAVGLSCFALIVVLKRWPAVPGALLAVALSTIAAAIFSWHEQGLAIVGAVPEGLPTLGLPDFEWVDVGALASAALGVTLVGYSDNVLTARAVAAEQGYRIDANQELVAMGAINLTSGLSGGFPVSSSASRSFVPASIGTRSQLVSLVAAGFVAATLVFLGPILSSFPQAALGGVILAAAVAIIDIRGFREVFRVSRVECGLAFLTAAGVMIFDVLVGVVVALALSGGIALWRIARPCDAVLGVDDDVHGWVSVDEFPGAQPWPGMLVYRFDAPLFFANAEWFRERVGLMLEKNPGDETWLVCDFGGVGSIDTTAVQMLRALCDDLHAIGLRSVCVARANHATLDRLERAQLLAPVGPMRSFPTIAAAGRAFAVQDDAKVGDATAVEQVAATED